MIHLITRISVIGIAVTTAALIILIAAFNGIESMVEKLYSEFDSNLTIRSAKGKTFDENDLNIKRIKAFSEVKHVCKAVEEIVILKHEKKWANAQVYGVEEEFLNLAQTKNHLVDGDNFISKNEENFALIGATLLDKLQGFIPQNGEHESLIIYFPKRDAKISVTSNPFRSELIQVAGRLNYNKEVNEEAIIVPLDLVRNALNYDSHISSVYINCKNKEQLFDLQEKIQNEVGKNFLVETHFQKNALIYQTSETEKVIVICILVFVFILAIFNLVASLTMLFIEKKDNLETLKSFGANKRFIFKIFFYEGLLISFKGIVLGLILGLFVAGLQLYFKLLILPNSGGQAFPISLTFKDTVFVFGIVSIISILASYLSISFLLKSNKADEFTK
ncbi:MAG: FtsX-like permease family protein [Bacteroidota bacterium]